MRAPAFAHTLSHALMPASLALLLAACQPAQSPAPAPEPAPAASAPAGVPAAAPASAEGPAGFVPPAADAPAGPASAAAPVKPAPAKPAQAESAKPASAEAAAPKAPEQVKPPEEAVVGALAFFGGMHALGMHCGRLNALQQAAERDRIKAEWVASGKVIAAHFDAMYRVAFDGTSQRIQANPTQAQQGCAQYDAMQAKGLKAAQALGLSKP